MPPVSSNHETDSPFDFSQISKPIKKLNPSDFDFVALAGRGAFGIVWVVRMKDDYSGKVMAMKVINKKDVCDKNYVNHTILEKEIMKTIRVHPFIVDLYFTFQTNTCIYIVMEYLPGGHLLSYVQDSPDPWPEEWCRFYGGETLLALEFMHSENIIYRDLKLENILLDMDGHIRLSDFGLSAILKSSTDKIHSMSGTAAYLAPETLQQKGHGKSVDIWAFGVVMFVLLIRESPFYSENLSELFRMILEEPIEWNWFINEISSNALSLLKGLLTKDPKKRLGCGPAGISEIKAHPFFAGTNFDSLLSMKEKTFIRPKLRIAERATDAAKNELMSQSSNFLSKKCKKDEFFGFSFVASDYIGNLESETYDEITLMSMTEDDDVYPWPFLKGSLPLHIITKIIFYLTIQDIGRVSRVCRSWNQYIWTIITEIDFSTIPTDKFRTHWKSCITATLLKPKRLVHIKMSTAATDETISFLPNITSVETLDLSHCTHLTSKSLKMLAGQKKTKIDDGMVKYQYLQILYLSGNSLTDDSLSYLLPYKNLTQLYLANTGITGHGLLHIIQLKNLWRIDLQGLPKLRDSMLEKLAELPHLRVLELTGCSTLTSNGVESLKTKLKHLEVLTWNEGTKEPESKAKKRRLKLGLTRKTLKKDKDKDKEKEKEREKEKVISNKKRGRHKKSISVDNSSFSAILDDNSKRNAVMNIISPRYQKGGKHRAVKKSRTRSKGKYSGIEDDIKKPQKLFSDDEIPNDRDMSLSPGKHSFMYLDEASKPRLDVGSLLADLGRKAHNISSIENNPFETNAVIGDKKIRSKKNTETKVSFEKRNKTNNIIDTSSHEKGKSGEKTLKKKKKLTPKSKTVGLPKSHSASVVQENEIIIIENKKEKPKQNNQIKPLNEIQGEETNFKTSVRDLLTSFEAKKNPITEKLPTKSPRNRSSSIFEKKAIFESITPQQGKLFAIQQQRANENSGTKRRSVKSTFIQEKLATFEDKSKLKK